MLSSHWLAGPGALVLLAGAQSGSVFFFVCVFSVASEADKGTDPRTGKFVGQVPPAAAKPDGGLKALLSRMHSYVNVPLCIDDIPSGPWRE